MRTGEIKKVVGLTLAQRGPNRHIARTIRRGKTKRLRS
jgi:hypothetical protein